jgi:multidrug efflux system outer membrane protein
MLILLASLAGAAPLSLDDAVRLATTDSHQAAVANGRVDEAEAASGLARAQLLPQVFAQAQYLRWDSQIEFANPFDPDPNAKPLVLQAQDTLNLQFTASQVLFSPATFSKAIAADAAKRAARAAGDGAVQDVAVMAVQMWIVAKSADEFLNDSNAALADAKDHLAVAQSAKEAGAVTELAVDRAELTMNQAEQRVIEAQKSRADAFGQLALLTRTDVTELGELVVDVTPAPTSDELAARALENRPEVIAAQESLAAAKGGRWQVAADWAPSVTENGYFKETNNPGFFKNPSWYVGLTATLPILDGGTRFADAKRVSAQVEEARNNAASAEESAQEGVRASVRALESALEALGVARKQVEIATRARQITEVGFTAGSATSLEVQDAQNQLLDAQVGQIRAEGDVVSARWTLKRATGDAKPQ